MQLSNEEWWKKSVEANMDDYGSGIVRFAERWADLIESAMAEGQSLEDCAQELSHKADTEGITGFMYGAAVAILSRVWVHGEALRRWHNKQYNGSATTEIPGAVVNPAIITINTDR